MSGKAMRSGVRLAVFLLCVSLACGAAVRAQAAPPAARAQEARRMLGPAEFAAKADEYLRAQAAFRGFSGSVLVAVAGQPLLARGYGYANAEWQIPNAPDTKHRLGSITKQFTATLVLQLQEANKLSVQDSVCKYLDPCPDAWKSVTIHHLLTHTSGIPSYTNQPDYRKNSILPKTIEEMIAGIRSLPMDFQPGEQFRYSNSGYFLLGAILEQVTGKKYEEVLRESIFAPLGMNDSGYDWSGPLLPRRASGYARAGAAIRNASFLDMQQPYSAGALYSTAEDLLKWDQALYTKKVLPAHALEAMWTPFKGDYAYGWVVRNPSPATFGRRQISHGGGINGFSTLYARYPEERVAIIVLANNEDTPAGPIGRDLAAILFGAPYRIPAERKIVSVNPALYDGYAGEYEFAPNFILTVTRDGNRLLTQATGQPQAEIFPMSETKFFPFVVDAEIEFVRGADGKATELILYQGGREQRARRIR